MQGYFKSHLNAREHTHKKIYQKNNPSPIFSILLIITMKLRELRSTSLLPYGDDFSWIEFNDENNFLFHLIYILLWLTLKFLLTLYIRNLYLSSESIFCVFMLPFSQFELSLLSIMCIHLSTNLMEMSFESLGRITIFDVSLLDNLPISFICSFK